MTELAITAVGPDRPGIVAAFTEALYQVGANLQDCRAALLRGSFAMVMAVSIPDGLDADAVQSALQPVAEAQGLTVLVQSTVAEAEVDADECTVSVYGADHPGIVSAVTRVLADLAVNIEDLSSRRVGDPPVYVLGIECALPSEMTTARVLAALRPVAQTQNVEVSVSSSDDEVL